MEEMKNVYFLSDAHLGSRAIAHGRTQERRLVSFLDSIKHKAAAVYLLGDMFDFRHFVGKNAFVKDFNVSYSYIDKDKESEPNIVSQYALEYLKHKVVAQTNLRLYSKLNLNISYRWQDRIGNYTTDGKTMSYKPYTLLDARLSWDAKQYRLFAEANNILNKTYYDHGNVPQPGIWVRAGATYRFNF